MDWEKIKADNPNAFQCLIEDHATNKQWGEIDNPEVWGEIIDEPHWFMRHLYDFFDSKGIITMPLYIWMDKYWGYEIFTEKSNWDENTSYKTREDAEIALFTKAFEILELYLINK